MTPTRMTAWLEQAWLTRYLDRQLGSEETAWFEAYVLDKPELLATIEIDTSLRDALAADPSLRQADKPLDSAIRQPTAIRSAEANRLHIDAERDSDSRRAAITDGAAPPASATQPTPISPAWLDPNVRRKSIAPAWLAMAASLFIGLGLGFVGTRTIVPGNTAPELIASPTRVIYDTMRGEETPPRVEHADSKSPYVLIEVAVPPGAENIKLKIGDEPEQVLPPSPDGFVSFLASRSSPGPARNAKIMYTLGSRTVTNPIELDQVLAR
jgi:hypothetical protein